METSRTKLNTTKIVYGGKTFPSVRALSIYYGIPYKTFHARLKAGWSLKESVERSLRTHSFEYGGKSFQSHKHFADFYKLDYGTHVSRIGRGWTLDESIDPSIRKAKSTRISYAGDVFHTIKDFTDTYGLSYSSVSKRLAEGWTAEECIDPSLRQEVRYTYDGDEFHSLKAFANHHKLHYGNTIRRYRSGWSLAECIDPATRKRPISRSLSVTVQGQNFESVKSAAEDYGETASNVNARLRRGWTIEQAVGAEDPPQRKICGKPCEFLGKQFPNIKSRDLFYNSPTSRIEKRLARGWTERQAVDLDPKPNRFRTADGKRRTGGWKCRETIDGRAYPKAAMGEYKLYEIRNSKNKKVYVGITIGPLEARLRGHRRSAVGLNENNKFHNAMRKHGAENFTIHLIRNDATSFKELGSQETAEIEARKTIENGYNVSKGGDIGTSKPIMIDGVLYASYASAAECFGIEGYLFNQRIRAGKSPEEAAEIVAPARPYKYEITVGKKTYPSLQKACASLGLSYKMVWRRINNFGWTESQALGVKPPPKSYEKYLKKNITVDAMKFSSQKDMANFLNVSTAAISKRVTAGESYMSIFEHFKNNGGRRRNRGNKK